MLRNWTSWISCQIPPKYRCKKYFKMITNSEISLYDYHVRLPILSIVLLISYLSIPILLPCARKTDKKPASTKACIKAILQQPEKVSLEPVTGYNQPSYTSSWSLEFVTVFQRKQMSYNKDEFLFILLLIETKSYLLHKYIFENFIENA